MASQADVTPSVLTLSRMTYEFNSRPVTLGTLKTTVAELASYFSRASMLLVVFQIALLVRFWLEYSTEMLSATCAVSVGLAIAGSVNIANTISTHRYLVDPVVLGIWEMGIFGPHGLHFNHIFFYQGISSACMGLYELAAEMTRNHYFK